MRSRKPFPALEFYGLVGISVSVAGAFLLYEKYSFSHLESWLIAVNAMAILFFGLDKLRARYGWGRIPEAVLLGLVLLGGSAGGLVGMVLLQHKIRKASFMRRFWILVAIQIVGLCIWFVIIK